MPEGKVTVPSTLSGHAAEIYRSAFLSAYQGTCAKPGGRRGGQSVSRDACAAKVAWGAVKGSYKKGKEGKWVAKTVIGPVSPEGTPGIIDPVLKAGDPVIGPISDSPSQTGLPVFGTGMDHVKGEGTKLQRWRMAYIKALRDECRNAEQPVECARRKANAAAGYVETDVKPIQRGGPGSGHRGHKGRPGEVGGSLPSGAAGAGAKRPTGAGFGRPRRLAEEPERYERSPRERKLDGMRRHKFLTKELEKALPPLYSQEDNSDPMVIAKWFHPFSSWNWFATEYEPSTGTFFGWVKGDFPELGYFSRQELSETLVRGLPIERDKYFNPKPLSQIQAEYQARSVYRMSGETYPLIKIKSGNGSNGRSVNMDEYRDYPLSYIERREFDAAKRKQMAEAGTAMSDGSFPIAACEDVTFALRSLGRTAKPRAGVVSHILKQGKALGCKTPPSLKSKAAAIERYLDRQVLRTRANDVDLAHIRTLADNPIDRPGYIPSEIWRTLPPEQRTVRAEATRRIIERNYAQAVEDAEMTGWRVRPNQYNPDEFYFTKRFSTRGEIDGVSIRAILVRREDSVDWELRAMSGFASGSIAERLPNGIVRHTIKDRVKLPLLEG